MLETNQWLLALTICVLSMQGTQLRFISSVSKLIAIAITIPIVTFLVSSFVALNNILEVQGFLKKQSQFILLIIMTEAALLYFFKPVYKLPLISAIGALFYGQLLFFQSGLVDLSFDLQGIIYGIGISVLIFINRLLAAVEEIWCAALFGFLVILVILITANQSKSDEVLFQIEYDALSISIIFTIACVSIGYVFGTIKLLKLRNK